MSDQVQFDTDMQTDALHRPGPAPGFGQAVPEESGMAGWLMRHRLAKSSRSAQGMLVAVIVVDLIATFVVIKYFV